MHVLQKININCFFLPTYASQFFHHIIISYIHNTRALKPVQINSIWKISFHTAIPRSRNVFYRPFENPRVHNNYIILYRVTFITTRFVCSITITETYRKLVNRLRDADDISTWCCITNICK